MKMKFLKNLLKRTINNFGFEIYKIRKSGVKKRLGKELNENKKWHANQEIFTNLSNGYETLLNITTSGKNEIKPNNLRPFLLSRLLGTPPSEAYFIIQALAQLEYLEGDVCEFGVAQGETSVLIANEILSLPNKKLHLFDSFEGLPLPTEKDQLKDDIFNLGSIDLYAGKMKCPENMVISRLKSISFPNSRFVIHRGFIEKIINTDLTIPKRVSFAYVDFDFYEPTKIVLNYLHSVTPKGAVIIIDDYDYFSTGVKQAVDEFITEKNLTKDPDTYEISLPDKRFGCCAILNKINL